MERILVSMSAHQGAWEAWSRAISLAMRIEARIFALLVLPSPAPCAGDEEKDMASVKRRLELLIELAKSEGIRIDYFISEGEYEEEVIRFVDHNRITLLVAESDGENRSPERAAAPIRKILHRIACRVELVSPRKKEQFNKKGNRNGHSSASISSNRRK